MRRSTELPEAFEAWVVVFRLLFSTDSFFSPNFLVVAHETGGSVSRAMKRVGESDDGEDSNQGDG